MRESLQLLFSPGDVLALRHAPYYGIGVVVQPEEYPGYNQNPERYNESNIFIKRVGGWTCAGYADDYLKIGTSHDLQSVRGYLAREREEIITTRQQAIDNHDARVSKFVSFLEKVSLS